MPVLHFFLDPSTLKHKEEHKKLPFGFPRTHFVVNRSSWKSRNMGGFAKILLVSLQLTLGWERHLLQVMGTQTQPSLVASGGIGSVLNQAISFLWNPMCAHNKGSFPPIGFCLNGFLWYGLSSALICSYLNPGILLNSKFTLLESGPTGPTLMAFPPSCLRLSIKYLGFPI